MVADHAADLLAAFCIGLCYPPPNRPYFFVFASECFDGRDFVADKSVKVFDCFHCY